MGDSISEIAKELEAEALCSRNSEETFVSWREVFGDPTMMSFTPLLQPNAAMRLWEYIEDKLGLDPTKLIAKASMNKCGWYLYTKPEDRCG